MEDTDRAYELHCDNMASNPCYRLNMWIEYLYDYGVDIDDNGNPDIIMQTIAELQTVIEILRRKNHG